MLEFGGGLVGVGPNDTLHSLIKSWISCFNRNTCREYDLELDCTHSVMLGCSGRA